MKVDEIGSITSTLTVTDLAKSRFFYEKLLQLRVSHEFEDEKILCFSWGNCEDIILRIRQGKTNEFPTISESLGAGVTFILQVGRGYQYANKPFDDYNYPYEYDCGCVVACDPNGYKWILAG